MKTTGVRALKDRLVTAALVLRIDGASYRSGVSAPRSHSGFHVYCMS